MGEYNQKPQNQRLMQGFTLLELSIVLVIIGLIVGGVTVGAELIRQAELKSVTTDFNKFQTAVNTFNLKYNALPGDMKNATDYWGTAAACPGTSTTPSTSAATCNGNGDGALDPAVATGNEMFRFWHHLANAGLVEGTFTGVANNTTASEDDAMIGSNVPASKVGNSGWTPQTLGTQSQSSTVWFEGDYGTVLHFGSMGSGTSTTRNAALVTEEAFAIDTKTDDGKPGTGTIRTREGAGVNCNTVAASSGSTIAATAAYNLAITSVECNLIYDLY